MVEQHERQMLAVIMDSPGEAEVLKIGSRPYPVPGEGEIILKVEYSALNRADVMQRKGNYPPPPGATDVLGLKCLGRQVLKTSASGEETLSETRFIALLPGGGYAQYVKVR